MSDINRGKVIAVAGNQSVCADICRALCGAGYVIKYLLHVDESQSSTIADYTDLRPLAEQLGMEVIHPVTYAMRDERSEALFKDIRIDLLVSAGWQRIFPKWFLNSLPIGAFGMHGSADRLPKGRGRSPMNWSIIEGRDRFYTSLFKYDHGVDSGEVVGTRRFDITPLDTIQSVRHKNTVSQVQLLLKFLPDILDGRITLEAQPEDVQPTYYPKRTPEDGGIDWADTSERINRLVRGVSRPYPGAFTLCGAQRINIWGGHPFDSSLSFDETAPGEVAACFDDGAFVVQCGQGTYFVGDWDSPEGWRPREGMLLENMPNESWAKLESMYANDPDIRWSFARSGYARLLESLNKGGYTCRFFEEDDGSDGAVLLRHDVDKSLPMALDMARMEHDLGIRSTFFFLTRGALYNILEPESSAVLKEIHALGHRVGLHCDLSRIPGITDDVDLAVERELRLFESMCLCPVSRAVTFHNPPSEIVGRTPESAAYISGYAPRFMLPSTKYISDSNACWREGDPMDKLAAREWPRVQILVHPLWWMQGGKRRALNVLDDVLSARGGEQRHYLRSSNHLYKTGGRG